MVIKRKYGDNLVNKILNLVGLKELIYNYNGFIWFDFVILIIFGLIFFFLEYSLFFFIFIFCGYNKNSELVIFFN